MFLDQQSDKILSNYKTGWHNLFLLYVQVEENRNIVKLRCRPLAFTSYKPSLKNEKWSETCLSASFSACFVKKNIYHVLFS